MAVMQLAVVANHLLRYGPIWPWNSPSTVTKTKEGIIGISQKPGSLERWFLTCHARAAMTMAMKEMCGLEDSERVGTHKDVGQNRQRRDEEDVQKLMSTLISGTIRDPFSSLDEDSEYLSLINIATGVVMPTDMTNSLNRSWEQGAARLKTIVDERLNTDKVSFWCPIQKLSISTFQTLSKKKVLAKDKISALVSDRDLFGRLVIAGRSRAINMEEVLSYELTTVPYSLAHMDGSLRKTTKSDLLSELEKKTDVQANLPPVLNGITSAHLIDAMASVQMLKGGSCVNFGDLAVKHYDATATPLGLNGCMRVDVVFDQYNELSIKAGKRDRRGVSAGLEVRITSQTTPIPKQCRNILQILKIR